MAISFKGAHFPQDIILMGVRWYLAYPLSYRHVEELLEERGVPIDHATVQRWVVKYSPQLEEAFWTCSHDTGHIWEEILPRPSESMSRTLKDLERQAFTVFWGMIH